jgi:capsular exopolysaccharide synthesis family protein
MHAPAHPAQSQLSGADVLRVIRSNIWMILPMILASGVLGYLANIYLNKYHKRYTAVGWVQVQPAITWNPLDEYQERPDNMTLQVDLRTQARLLEQDALFSRVLVKPQSPIRQTEWFKEHFRDGKPDVALAKEDLRDRFSVAPVPDSRLISVSMTYRIPKDARVVVEEIVTEHLAEQRSLITQRTQERTQTLNNLKTKYQNLVKTAAQDRREKEARLGDMSGTARMYASGKEYELAELMRQIAVIKAEMERHRRNYESFMGMIQSGVNPPEVEELMMQNQELYRLKQGLEMAEADLRGMPTQGTAMRNQSALLESRREYYQTKLDAATADIKARYQESMGAKLRNEFEASQAQHNALAERIAKVTGELGELSQTMSDFLTARDEEASYRELLKEVSDKLEQLTSTTSQDVNSVSWALRPETPDIPSFPKLPITLAVAIALGTFLSLGIAFLKEAMDTTVRSPRDIAKVGQLNLLGMIPHEDDDPQSAGVPLTSVIHQAPQSIIAEQFRQVRTRLQHAASLDTTRSILVTSPGPGDGKTVVACNLAAGLALNGRRILLVDANFRRPELHRAFAQSNDTGLSTVLNDVSTLPATVRQSTVPNLDILTAGPKPGNATELIESQRFTDFVDRALEEYDHVIFDSGPLLVVSETVALAPRVDGVVTVVRARTNSRGLLQRLRDELRKTKAEQLGVVLNAVRSSTGGYYGKEIRKYYEYQESEE